jgi:hypothetical protein
MSQVCQFAFVVIVARGAQQSAVPERDCHGS